MSTIEMSESEVRRSVREAVFTLWRRIVPATLIGVFLAEIFVMFLLEGMGLRWGTATHLLDASLLTFLIAPGLYLVVLRPVGRLSARFAVVSADARFRAVVEAASDAIIVGDSHGKIMYANPAVTAVLDYSPADLQGKEIAILVPEDQRDRHREGLRRFVGTMEAKVVGRGPVEMEALSKDGSRIPVELTLSAPTLGTEVLFVGVIRDLRQRRRMGLYEALLPVCSVCGIIRDDTGVAHGQGSWVRLEEYVQRHAAACFSHTFCPKCNAEIRSSLRLDTATPDGDRR